MAFTQWTNLVLEMQDTVIREMDPLMQTLMSLTSTDNYERYRVVDSGFCSSMADKMAVYAPTEFLEIWTHWDYENFAAVTKRGQEFLVDGAYRMEAYEKALQKGSAANARWLRETFALKVNSWHVRFALKSGNDLALSELLAYSLRQDDHVDIRLICAVVIFESFTTLTPSPLLRLLDAMPSHSDKCLVSGIMLLCWSSLTNPRQQAAMRPVYDVITRSDFSSPTPVEALNI